MASERPLNVGIIGYGSVHIHIHIHTLPLLPSNLYPHPYPSSRKS